MVFSLGIERKHRKGRSLTRVLVVILLLDLPIDTSNRNIPRQQTTTTKILLFLFFFSSFQFVRLATIEWSRYSTLLFFFFLFLHSFFVSRSLDERAKVGVGNDVDDDDVFHLELNVIRLSHIFIEREKNERTHQWCTT